MSVIIRLQNLPWSANAGDIRGFFKGLHIPEGGVHIVGGEQGDAFIAFASDEDARLAMRKTGEILKGIQISLLLSSRSEMQKVIETARQQALAQQSFLGSGAAAPSPAPVIPPQPVAAQHPAYTNPPAPVAVAPAPPVAAVPVPTQAAPAYGNVAQYYPGPYGQQQQPPQQPYQQQQFPQQAQQSSSYYGRPSAPGPMVGSEAAMHQKAELSSEYLHPVKQGYNQPSAIVPSDPSEAMMPHQQPQPVLKPPFGYGSGPMHAQYGSSHPEPGRGDPRWQRKEDSMRVQPEPMKSVEDPRVNQYEAHGVRPPASYENNHQGPDRGRMSFKEVLDEKELYKLSQPVKPSFDSKSMTDAKAGFEALSRTPTQSRLQQPAYGQPGSMNQMDASGQYRDHHRPASESNSAKSNETEGKNHSSSYNSHGAPVKKGDYSTDKKHDRSGGSNRDREKDIKERDRLRDIERSSVKDTREKDAFDRDRDIRRRRSKSLSRSRSRERDRRRRHRSRSRSRDRGSRRRRSRSKERQERSRDKDKARSTSNSARDRPERRISDGTHDKTVPDLDPNKIMKNSGATLPGLGEIPDELPKGLPTTILGKPASQEMITSDMYASGKPHVTGASPMQQMWDATSASEPKNKVHNERSILKNEHFPHAAYSTTPPAKPQSSRWGPPKAAKDEKAEMMAFNAAGAHDAPLNRPKEAWGPPVSAPGSWDRHRPDDSNAADQFPRERAGVTEKPPQDTFPQDRYQRENRPFDPRIPSSAEHPRENRPFDPRVPSSAEHPKKDYFGGDPRRPPITEHQPKDSWGISEPPHRGVLPPRDRNARSMTDTPEMRPRDPMYPEEGSRSGGPIHRDAPARPPIGYREGAPRGPIIPPANSRVLLATPDIPPRGPMHGPEEWHSPSNKPYDEERDPRARDVPPFREGMNERAHHAPDHFKDNRHPLDRPGDDRRPLNPMHDRRSLERGVDDRRFSERMGEKLIGDRPPIIDRRQGEGVGGSPFMEDRNRVERFGGEDQFHEGKWEGTDRGMGRRGGFEGSRGFGRGGRRGPVFFDDAPLDPYALDGRRTATPPAFDRPMRGGFRGGDVPPGPPGFPVEQRFDGVRQSPPISIRGRGAFPRGRGAPRGGGAPPPVMPERLATCSVEVLNLPPRVSYRSVREAFFGIYMPKHCIKLLGDENGVRIGVALIRFQNERDALEAIKCDGTYVFESQIRVKLIDEEIYDKHEDANSIQFPGRGPVEHINEGPLPSEWLLIMGMPHAKDEEAVAAIFKAYYINDILKEVIPGTKKATGGFFMRVSCPEEACAVVHDMDGAEVGGNMLHLRQAVHEDVMRATLKPADRHLIEEADPRGPPRDTTRSQNPHKLVRDHRAKTDDSKKAPLLATPNTTVTDTNNGEKVNNNNNNNNNNNDNPEDHPAVHSPKQNSQTVAESSEPLQQPESSSVKRPIEEVEPSHQEEAPSAKKAAPNVDLLTDSVVISDVKMGTTRADVIDFFSDNGLIPETIHFLPYDQQKGGRIYVVFPLISNAKQAIKKSGQFLGPSSIRIDLVAKPEVMAAMKLPFNPLELIKKGDGSLPRPAAQPPVEVNRQEPEISPTAPSDPIKSTSSSPALPVKVAEERSKPVRLIRQPLTDSTSQKPARQQKPPPTEPASAPKQGEVIPDQFGQPGCVIALGNVPLHATTEDIIAFLSADFPHIVPENVIRRYNEHNQPTSDARVAFESAGQAKEAIGKLSKRSIFNRSISLSLV